MSFGLVSIPVRLFRAARAERVRLRRLYRVDDSAAPATGELTKKNSVAATEDRPLAPVQQAAIRPETNELVPRRAVVKGYEYEKERFVAVEAEELKAAAPPTSTSMEIEECVELAAIDPVYFETSYYVVPEEAGEKAYALLYRSLQLSGLVALAQFAMHGREHVVVLRPGKSGLLAHTMYFSSEVRADDEFHADWKELSKKELELAQTLIRSLAAPFEPAKYHDSYRERIQAVIDEKVQKQPRAASPDAPKRAAAVIDIADALRRSLAGLKKPVASAPDSPASTSRAKRAGRRS